MEELGKQIDAQEGLGRNLMFLSLFVLGQLQRYSFGVSLAKKAESTDFFFSTLLSKQVFSSTSDSQTFIGK